MQLDIATLICLPRLLSSRRWDLHPNCSGDLDWYEFYRLRFLLDKTETRGTYLMHPAYVRMLQAPLTLTTCSIATISLTYSKNNKESISLSLSLSYHAEQRIVPSNRTRICSLCRPPLSLMELWS